MPPPLTPLQKPADTDHMLARPKPSGEGGLEQGHRAPIGPIVGAIIIIIILAFGALYFWGEYLNSQNTQQEVPLIQGDVSL